MNERITGLGIGGLLALLVLVAVVVLLITGKIGVVVGSLVAALALARLL